jgi:hypothetical protein
MSTLTYSTSTRQFAPGTQPTRKSLWRRIFEALAASRERHAEREIAAYLSGRGGMLTDELEREITLRLIGGRNRTV